MESSHPEISQDLIPLFSLEAEMGVLGSMILSGRAVEEVAPTVREEDFYRPAHRLIYKSILQLSRQSKAVDLVTISEELKARGNLADVGGIPYLVQIAEYVPSPANVHVYADIVLDKATLRRMEQAGRELVGLSRATEPDSVKEKVSRAEQTVFQIGQRDLRNSFRPIQEMAREYANELGQLYDSGIPNLGVPSGYSDLDRLTGGFYPGEMTIVGARPSMGKTAFVLNIATNVAGRLMDTEDQGSVAIFSLEMSSISLVRRIVSSLAQVSQTDLKKGKPAEAVFTRVWQATESVYDLPIFVDDTADLSAFEMRAKCRRLKAERGLTMVIVDYLQLMRGTRRTENRVQEISEIARGLKAMAKELNVPVIALSQLSRGVENRDDKRPQLADLRESGSIEAEADLVALLYRASYYKAKEEKRAEFEDPHEAQEAEVIIAKNRNGATGKVILGFQPAFTRFVQLARERAYADED